jgi:hypothetical protein
MLFELATTTVYIVILTIATGWTVTRSVTWYYRQFLKCRQLEREEYERRLPPRNPSSGDANWPRAASVLDEEESRPLEMRFCFPECELKLSMRSGPLEKRFCYPSCESALSLRSRHA